MRQGAWSQKVEIWGVQEINLHCKQGVAVVTPGRQKHEAVLGKFLAGSMHPPPWGSVLGTLPYAGRKRRKAEVPRLIVVLKQIIARVKVVY